MPITATYTPALFRLSVFGTIDPDVITISRDGAGALFVNGGAVAVSGGTPTVANTTLVELAGDAGIDTIVLDESNGALPAAAIYGGGANDVLTAGSANDTLDGGSGADTMTGGLGDDWFYVDDAGDVVIEGVGGGSGDRIRTSVSYTLGAGVHVERFTTTDNFGTAALFLTGNELANLIYGNAGDNTLDGSTGADALVGFGGNDTYYVDNAADTVNEGAGDGTLDRVLASVSYRLGAATYVEQLRTVDDAATTAINLTGNELANALFGNAGANVLDGKAGADTLTGFGGDDWYYVDNAADVVVDTAGNDRLLASVNYTLGAGVQIELFTTSDNLATAPINLTGNELANLIYGNAGANVLDGGTGKDTMVGLEGDDTYYFDNVQDRIIEYAGGGHDRVYASAGVFSLDGVDVEDLYWANPSSTGGAVLKANDLSNHIEGSAGRDQLDGRGGVDTMIGFAGGDSYTVDDINDVVIEAAGQGIDDRVNTSASYTLPDNVEELWAQLNSSSNFTTPVTLTGNTLANEIHGNAGDNVIDGKAGADTLWSNGGNDTFVFSTALGAANVDHLGDFNPALDTIQLDSAIFTALSPGALPAGAFQVFGVAMEADDRILFDAGNHSLKYDPDGTGAAAAVEFARIVGFPAITAADFVVV